MPKATPSQALPFVEAELRYIKRDAEIATKFHYEADKSTLVTEPHRVRIYNGRARQTLFGLEKNGFVLTQHKTSVLNFDDPKQLASIYYPEVERLVKELTGAKKVIMFHPAIREEGSEIPPAANVHIDYDEIQYHRWAEQVLGPDVANEYLQRRFIGINVWRPIRAVERMPLAVCDASTMAPSDLKPALIRDRVADAQTLAQPRTGFHVVFNPAQRWYYFSDMQPDEVLVFKIADSDRGRVQWTAHTGFDDPTSKPGARPRKSFEIRTLAFMAE